MASKGTPTWPRRPPQGFNNQESLDSLGSRENLLVGSPRDEDSPSQWSLPAAATTSQKCAGSHPCSGMYSLPRLGVLRPCACTRATNQLASTCAALAAPHVLASAAATRRGGIPLHLITPRKPEAQLRLFQEAGADIAYRSASAAQYGPYRNLHMPPATDYTWILWLAGAAPIPWHPAPCFFIPPSQRLQEGHPGNRKAPKQGLVAPQSPYPSRPPASSSPATALRWPAHPVRDR